MRRAAAVLLLLLASVAGRDGAQAGFDGFSPGLTEGSSWIAMAAPTLPPIAHSRFCIEYPGECRVRKIAFRPSGPVALSAARMRELSEVNRKVNRSIIPRRNRGGVLTERWAVFPKHGECHDYAVSKRHELLERGWPSRSLLLAEVVIPSGEHHLVLLVRSNAGDLLLDNLSADIRPWSRAPYRWIRAQSPTDPALWSTTG
jgi:predicted transglutaminase-like cysteine proteinase